MDKQKTIESESHRLKTIYKQVRDKGNSLAQLLCRPENSYQTLLIDYPEEVKDFGPELNFQIELNLKYAGYINRQIADVEKLSHIEKIKVPAGFDFTTVVGLRNEAKQKLARFTPQTLGQASRISGVSPSDIQVLMIAMQKYGNFSKT